MNTDLFGDMGVTEHNYDTLMEYIISGEFERGINHLKKLNNQELAHQVLHAGLSLMSIKHHGRKSVINDVAEQINRAYIAKSDDRLFHVNAMYKNKGVSGKWSRMTISPMTLHKCRIMASKFDTKYTVQFAKVERTKFLKLSEEDRQY